MLITSSPTTAGEVLFFPQEIGSFMKIVMTSQSRLPHLPSSPPITPPPIPWVRCGRAGRPGIVVNLSTPDTKFVVGKFSKQLGLRFDDCEIRESRLWALSRDGLRPEVATARLAAEEYGVESEWKSGRIMEEVDGTGGVSEGLYGTIEVSGGMSSGTISEGGATVIGGGGLGKEGKSGEVPVAEENEILSGSMGHGFPRYFEAVEEDAESLDDVTGFHEAFLETDNWVSTGGEEAEGGRNKDPFEVSTEGGERGGMEEGSPRGEVASKVSGGVAFVNPDSEEGWDEDDWGDGDWGDGDVSGDYRENGEG